LESVIKYFIFILFSTLLLANNYPNYTEDDYIKIARKSGNIAKNRAKDYQETVLSFKIHTKSKQLNEVNLYLNQLLPQYDTVIQNKEDYWATPKEFLCLGYGDCEDYVIIKYFTLLKLGFNKEKLFFTTVHEKFAGGYHMVLSYFKIQNQSPLILDNLSFKILPLKDRKDLDVDLFINHSGIYKLNLENKLIKLHNKSYKFNKLLKKISQEN